MQLTDLTENFSILSEERPIKVLVITLIFTIHQARGCAPPPNLKNSIISKISQTHNIRVKGRIIFPIAKFIPIYIKLKLIFFYYVKMRKRDSNENSQKLQMKKASIYFRYTFFKNYYNLAIYIIYYIPMDNC